MVSEPERQPAGQATMRRAVPAAHRIGIRELRQHASVYIDLVERGYTVDVTSRGRLVARLLPARGTQSPIEQLPAGGIILAAESPGALLDTEPAPPVPGGRPTASQILLRMRAEERQ